MPLHASTSTSTAQAHAGIDGPGMGLPPHQQKRMRFLIFQLFSQGLLAREPVPGLQSLKFLSSEGERRQQHASFSSETDVCISTRVSEVLQVTYQGTKRKHKKVPIKQALK